METGKLTVSRICSNNVAINNLIEICIETNENRRIVVARVKPEDFMCALTGLACVKCEIK